MRISTIAFANLKRRKGKALFLIVGISIGIGTVVALLSLSGSIKEEIGTQLDRFGANIVVVPQSNSLSLDYGGISVSKRGRAMSVLEKVGLGDKATRLPNQLSGGEQGRLAFARAIVNEPPLILADEPTGTLDTTTGNELMDVFLKRTLRDRPSSWLLTTRTTPHSLTG